ncbi:MULTISPECIES: glycerophosphodiester phosphodiesterase family protein [Candidatus Neomicrothrix]|nr:MULTISPECIES: glycerophosphodiester phosphodiesterase family protein [Microthrix]MBK6502883.1 glycerophosphodiester phosphodiesterase [Candidatus Microthrix sp.]MBK7021312.1 glycerophosphodiester phosphodiesterase [Candidatus Microthrix sp.]NLH66992.1 glycerophosphodiester phosphodiesterase [Candidatus Microthrix parvicella]
MTRASRQPHPYLALPGPHAIAHRGGASEAPENTMAAFRHAVRARYPYLETDTHATADGVLVAFHDDHLDRVTDREGPIAELPYSEVAKARVNGQSIPLLEELLEEFPEQRFNIDAKSDAAGAHLPALLRRTNALARVCLASFSTERLVRLRRELGDKACTAASPREIGQWRAGRVGTGFNVLQVPTTHKSIELVTRRTVARAHRAGVPVHVWTIDDPQEIERLLDLGVDGIITDSLENLTTALDRRGQWHPTV